MAATSGWWHLDCSVELNDDDLEHIAEYIKDGFTQGEIVGSDEDELEYEMEVE